MRKESRPWAPRHSGGIWVGISSQKGAVELIEASYLIPLAMVLVFLLIFLSMMVWAGAFWESQIYRALQQPVGSESFQNPDRIELGQDLTLDSTGRDLSVQGDMAHRALFPFRFFQRREALRDRISLQVNWASPARDMWTMEAFQSFLKKKGSMQ